RHAVSFETVCRWTHRVAGVVTRTVGDHAGVARIVFLDLEYDLHQIGADVRNLGENSTRDAQSRSTERFTDGKADKAWISHVSGHEQQNAKHEEKLDADQQHS